MTTFSFGVYIVNQSMLRPFSHRISRASFFSKGLFDDNQGTARLLSACKSQAQALEAAKNLLLGNLRVDMLR
jgi:hypothetical protein